jgi:tetratricopeptide (TPR) repeat protein
VATGSTARLATILCIEHDLAEEEALHWLIQSHRPSRGLNSYSRVLLALDLEPSLQERARANQQAGGQTKGSSNLTEAHRLDVRSETAAVAGVSTGNITKVKALRLNPNSADAFYNRGLVYESKGDHNRAIEGYSQALRLKPSDADSFYQRGLAYRHKGDYEYAIQDYSQALRFNPSNFAAFYNRGLAYAQEGDYDRAIQDYDQALLIKPTFGVGFASGVLHMLIKVLIDARSRTGAAGSG